MLVILKSIVLAKCVKMDMSANIRQMVHKNVTIFTDISAEKIVKQMAKYCHLLLTVNVFHQWIETLCSVKRLMILYMVSLKKRKMELKIQIQVKLKIQLLVKPLLQLRPKTPLTTEGSLPLHLKRKLPLEKNPTI